MTSLIFLLSLLTHVVLVVVLEDVLKVVISHVHLVVIHQLMVVTVGVCPIVLKVV